MADVKGYFEEVVAPLIAARFPDVHREMIVQVHGSYGLGAADRYSDLDAIIYLDDPLWRQQSGNVQLLMQHGLSPFTAANQAYCQTPGEPFAWPVFGHSEINVHPVTWLLDHHAREFLSGGDRPPWEQVSQQSLYELQHCVVLRDPQGLMARLRLLAAAERFPEWLWRKLIIVSLCDLKGEPWDLAKAVARGRTAEAAIISGGLLKSLLELGFLISRRCCPYRKYLWTAFAALPLATASLADFEVLVSHEEQREHPAAVDRILRTYTGCILAGGNLGAEALEDLFGARSGEAWHDPDWRRRQVALGEAAVAAGYDRRDAWIWGLWGWT